MKKDKVFMVFMFACAAIGVGTTIDIAIKYWSHIDWTQRRLIFTYPGLYVSNVLAWIGTYVFFQLYTNKI